MFKTLSTNRNEILTGFLGLLLFFALLFYGKTYFPPLAYALSFGYFVLILLFVCFSPWFIISITMPNTMGRFINEWFDAAWVAVGKPDSFRISRAGENLHPDDPEEDCLRAGELQRQLKLTLAVYVAMMLAAALVALAAFSQGISIPVIGQ